MSKILAIKGHPTRGNEVAEILEMMGGHNSKPSLLCHSTYLAYYIGNDNIKGISSHNGEYVVYTIEEFLEKFPYKVGDKVKLYYQDEENDRYCSSIPSTIIGMRWDKSCGEVAYKMKDIERECYRNEISYDSSNEPDAVISDINLNRTDYADEVEIKLGDYEIEVRDGRTFAVLKKPKYPKLTNLTECKEILGEKDMYQGVSGYKGELLTNFQRLFIFRNVYWKIAGEQMGLGKPWEPDLENEELYCIQNYNKQIIKSKTNTAFNKILIFPTEEMRDAFYENFKDLIEACKELL